MAQRVFVKVVGFDEKERHALDSAFRLSEDQGGAYSLWDRQTPSAAQLALIDGYSLQAQAEFEVAREGGIPVIWVGPRAPAMAMGSFDRPIPWDDVVRSMAERVAASSAAVAFDLDVDVDVGLGAVDFDFDDVDTLPPGVPSSDEPRRRALIVNADRDERLYIRAKLALAQLCEADEAETAAQALELARASDYVIAVVDFHLPDADGWGLLRDLGRSKRPIAKVILTKVRPSLAERLQARIAGAAGLFEKPPHPTKLHELLMKV